MKQRQKRKRMGLECLRNVFSIRRRKANAAPVPAGASYTTDEKTWYAKDSIENLKISQHCCPFLRKGSALTKQYSSGKKEQTSGVVNPLKN
jgi:hypothetical protein